jgi:RNA-directed DNA polymerase
MHQGAGTRSSAHDAVDRVARAIVQQKTRIIDIDLRSYFDNVRHDRLLAKVARRRCLAAKFGMGA